MAHQETAAPVGELVQVQAAGLAGERAPLDDATFGAHALATNACSDIVIGRLDAGRDPVRECGRLLSIDEHRRAARFAFPRDARRFIVGRALLRQQVAARLGVDAADVAFTYGSRGKPALAPAFAGSGLRFNVSHCDDVVVIAFSHGRDVGVDVEAVKPMGDADAIVAHFFSRAEQAAYAALAPGDRTCGFFSCWTRKEAFIKATGDGLRYPLDQFDVSLAPDQPARLLRVGNTPGEGCGWLLDSFAAGPSFVGAVVVASGSAR